jgi:mono/diheme cytochrome c family protein
MNRVLMPMLVGLSLLWASGAQAADKKTERLWNSKCASCHGKDGKGKTEKGAKMKLREVQSPEFQKESDAEFKKTINEGFKREHDGVKQEMDAYKDELKPAEIDALIAFMRELK